MAALGWLRYLSLLFVVTINRSIMLPAGGVVVYQDQMKSIEKLLQLIRNCNVTTPAEDIVTQQKKNATNCVRASDFPSVMILCFVVRF